MLGNQNIFFEQSKTLVILIPNYSRSYLFDLLALVLNMPVEFWKVPSDDRKPDESQTWYLSLPVWYDLRWRMTSSTPFDGLPERIVCLRDGLVLLVLGKCFRSGLMGRSNSALLMGILVLWTDTVQWNDRTQILIDCKLIGHLQWFAWNTKTCNENDWPAWCCMMTKSTPRTIGRHPRGLTMGNPWTVHGLSMDNLPEPGKPMRQRSITRMFNNKA